MFWKDATVEAVPADLAVVHGPVEQCHPVLGTGLGEHIAHVVVDRSFADGEPVSDFLIGQSFGTSSMISISLAEREISRGSVPSREDMADRRWSHASPDDRSDPA